MPDASTVALIEKGLHLLNDMSPAALLALVAILALAVLHKRGPIRQMQNNHLAHMQIALDKIVENGTAANTKLDQISADITWVKAKVD